MKWPDNLGFGDRVLVIYLEPYVRHDSSTLYTETGEHDENDPDLLAVIKLED